MKKTLFKTPVKDGEQLDSDVTVKLEQTDDVSILSKQPRLHDNNNDNKEEHKNKKNYLKETKLEKNAVWNQKPIQEFLKRTGWNMNALSVMT